MRIVALDIGIKRIGLAFADSRVRIAIPRGMIPADGNEFQNIAKQLRLEKADVLVCGLPRNNSGEETRQTAFVRDWVEQFKTTNPDFSLPIYFQDESYTSVVAEEHLGEVSRADRASGKVDSEAATLILQDFLEGAQLAQVEQQIMEKQHAN